MAPPGYGILRMSNFTERHRLLICIMRGNITGTLPKHASGRIKTNFVRWTAECRKELDDGRPEEVIDAINRFSSLPGYDKAICEREIGYFEKNKGRGGMRISGREVSS